MASLAPGQIESALEITNDPTRIDLDRVHMWLSRKSYWAGQMPRAVFGWAERGSLCLGVLKEGATVGFARVISDRATFAYVSERLRRPRMSWRGDQQSHHGRHHASVIRSCKTCASGCSLPRTRMACTRDAGSKRLQSRSGTWSAATRDVYQRIAAADSP